MRDKDAKAGGVHRRPVTHSWSAQALQLRLTKEETNSGANGPNGKDPNPRQAQLSRRTSAGEFHDHETVETGTLSSGKTKMKADHKTVETGTLSSGKTKMKADHETIETGTLSSGKTKMKADHETVETASRKDKMKAVETGKYQAYSCEETQNDNPIRSTTQEALKKLITLFDPPFWISLHSKKVDPIRWSVYTKGEYYETGLTNQFKQLLAGKSTSLVIDIGMNIGWYTLLAASLGHNVVAFEPNTMHHTKVCQSLKANGWTHDKVKVFPYGLAQKEKVLGFFTNDNNPDTGSFMPRTEEKRPLQLPVITLDGFAEDSGWFAGNAPDISIMKIDIEGYEPEAIRGASRLLKMKRIRNIFAEWSPRADKRMQGRYRSMVSLLLNSGYSLHSTSNGRGIQDDALLKQLSASQKSTKSQHVAEMTTLLNSKRKPINLWWRLNKRNKK